jgi:uncharacterized coiled-coil protein SlyX
VAEHDEHQARIARLDAMIARAKHLPSIPELAAHLARLTQAVETLQARVDALEQECEALRQRELLRLWDREG